MVGSSWSSSSSCTSSSFEEEDLLCVVKPDAVAPEGCIKFLCSYGGRILPRPTDGALRYVGGHNRVLSVDRSLHFYELQRKLREMCGGWDVSLRCQLPTEDLDALVSVTSDDDLANLVEEYDAAAASKDGLKIRAFLFPRTSTTNLSASSRTSPTANVHHLLHRQNSSPRWWAAPAPPQASSLRSAHRYLVHNGSHWQ